MAGAARGRPTTRSSRIGNVGAYDVAIHTGAGCSSHARWRCAQANRDDYYDDDSPRPGEIDILLRKNRHGALGDLHFAWQPERMRILPLTRH